LSLFPDGGAGGGCRRVIIIDWEMELVQSAAAILGGGIAAANFLLLFLSVLFAINPVFVHLM
jgi:hypothetical protein